MLLFGASGHAKVIVDILQKSGVRVNKILDDNPKCEEIFGIPVEKNTNNGMSDQGAIISIGNNEIRKKIVERYRFKYIQAIHPSAVISSYVKMGEGTVVMANAVLNPDVQIGKHCIVNTGAIVEHDCKIEDFVHISPNVALAGNVQVGEGTHIGIGASVIQGVKIGKWATVGAGAVVIRDIPDYAVVVGNPAKVIKMKNDFNAL
ncbi:acetyltransferase [Capnocytophaga canis]|uniref:acetyltransferase n=1 Tax=Capnocytophaga TaxID=1016 RepID=UPI000BB1AD0F|nr:acetyltransferase [Capnocytophaga sp. H4358]ATA72663.1 acetyltransferase [Capnocytophaga sp. H4358]